MIKVFLSWSGDTSSKIAKCLYDWLPMIIQSIKPFYSSEDIQKGDFWIDKINNELNVNDIGILCITPENQNSPWILFESGILSNGLGRKKINPLLFNMSISDLKQPLSFFNATIFSKSDFFKLLSDLNNISENPVKDEHLKFLFEKSWDDLNNKISNILLELDAKNDTYQRRDTYELIEELLLLQRNSLNIIHESNLKYNSSQDSILKNLYNINNSVNNICSNNQPIQIDELYNPTRPKKLDCNVYRFNTLHEEWLLIIVYDNQFIYEIHPILDNSFYIPKWVLKGWVIRNKSGNEKARYDFQFVDKDDYKVTIEGLNVRINVYSSYTNFINILLSLKVPIDVIIKILPLTKFSNFIEDDIWKTYIINLINSFVSDKLKYIDNN